MFKNIAYNPEKATCKYCGGDFITNAYNPKTVCDKCNSAYPKLERKLSRIQNYCAVKRKELQQEYNDLNYPPQYQEEIHSVISVIDEILELLKDKESK